MTLQTAPPPRIVYSSFLSSDVLAAQDPGDKQTRTVTSRKVLNSPHSNRGSVKMTFKPDVREVVPEVGHAVRMCSKTLVTASLPTVFFGNDGWPHWSYLGSK